MNASLKPAAKFFLQVTILFLALIIVAGKAFAGTGKFEPDGNGGGKFNFQPAFVFVLVTPDGADFWARVAGDHSPSIVTEGWKGDRSLWSRLGLVFEDFGLDAGFGDYQAGE